MFFKTKTFLSGTVRKLHLMRQYLHRLISLRPHLKINKFFYQNVLVKTEKKSGKSQGKIREFDGAKKVGTLQISVFHATLQTCGPFTLPDTETDTDTDRMRTEPNGNLHMFLSVNSNSMNTSTQFHTSHFLSVSASVNF